MPMPLIQLKRWRLAQEQPPAKAQEGKQSGEGKEPEKEEDTFRDLFGANKWARISGDELAKNPKLLQEFFDEITAAYQPLGGHLKFKTPQTLLNGDLVIYAADIDKDPESDAVVVTEKNPPGEKLLGIGHDDSGLGKQKTIEKTKEIVNTPGHYAEVSGALAHILLKAGAKPVLIEQSVRKVLSGKDLKWLGEHPEGKYLEAKGWYQRSIGGQLITKIMVGLPGGIRAAQTIRRVATAMLTLNSRRRGVSVRNAASSRLRAGATATLQAKHFRDGKTPERVLQWMKEGKKAWLFDCGKKCGKGERLSPKVVVGKDIKEAAQAITGDLEFIMTYKAKWQSEWKMVPLTAEQIIPFNKKAEPSAKGKDPAAADQGKEPEQKAASTRRRLHVAKASAYSEEAAFDLFLSFLNDANGNAVRLQDAIAALAEQEAEGEVALPPQAEEWRNFLKLAQKRVMACRGFLVGKMVDLFGVAPEDVEEPTSLPEQE